MACVCFAAVALAPSVKSAKRQPAVQTANVLPHRTVLAPTFLARHSCRQATSHKRPTILSRIVPLATNGEQPSLTPLPAKPDTPLFRVLSGIDSLNEKDPRKANFGGAEVPYELAYSVWMTEWIQRLTPTPSDELLIAARGQHNQRWKVPRTSYPEGKAGYFKWREDLKVMHSNAVVALMREAGYSEAAMDKVTKLMLKKQLGSNAEAQLLEDALCLVFLQYQFAEFRATTTDDKMVDILRKTWKKMGEAGKAAALKLPLNKEEAALVGRALSPDPAPSP